MAELVRGHEHADSDEEPQEFLQDVHQCVYRRVLRDSSHRGRYSSLASRPPGTTARHVAQRGHDATDRRFVERFPAQRMRFKAHRPTTKAGMAAVRLSMRSSTPPWPGSSLPLSLRPTLRLNMLCVRSPSTEIRAVATASGTSLLEGSPSHGAAMAAARPAVTRPPVTPSHVLPGLTAGASLVRPSRRPNA